MITDKKNEAIHINLGDKGGREVYRALDNYRHAKNGTWKQVVLQSLVLSMLTDGHNQSDIDVVTEYFGAPKQL